MTTSTDYPASWETHAVLKDGSTVEIRPIKASDRDALDAFHGRQSQESIYFRYFRYRPELSDKELDHFTQVNYRDRMAFVALLGNQLVAVARYERWDGKPVAEVAFFVDDDHHGKGLGTLMLEYLAAAARDRGFSGFTATVLPENYRMLGVFRKAGFEVSTRFADGSIEVDLGIEVTAETSSAIAERHRRSRARSVARIVEPETVAIIGASRERGSIGNALVANIVAARGGVDRDTPDSESADTAPANARLDVYPVNPVAAANGEPIAGLEVFPSIAAATAAAIAAGSGSGQEARTAIDLAVVAVRAELVSDIVAECAAAGVRGLLVISAGFAELDDDGEAREHSLVDTARDHGMRLIGPNAFGLVNTDPAVRLRAMFLDVRIRAGTVALASQSGPLGAAVLDRMRAGGLGLSSFVGIGNRADVSVNDLLDYWGLDDRTDVVVLYVENFGNLANLATVAKRTSEAKPIITIRPPSQETTELVRQSGVIVVDEVSQLAEQALLAATQPVPKSNRVAIVSNTASLGRLAVSACRRARLDVVMPASVSDGSTNGSVLVGDLDTVSFRPSSDPDDYERYVVTAAVSHDVDLLLIALVPTPFLPLRAMEELLDRINRSIDKPMAAIGLVGQGTLAVDGLPVFTFPEEAAQALGRHARYGQWRAARAARPDPASPTATSGPTVASELLAGRQEARLSMSSPDLPRLLDELAIPLAPYGLAGGREQVTEIAERIGYPVVIKAANLPSRSVGESGGAAIDLHDRAAVLAAYDRMNDRLGMAMKTTVVQQMVPSVGSVRLEVLQDPAYGALVSIGPGGSGFASVPPAARRFLPIDETTAGELVDAVQRAGALRSLDDAGRQGLVDLALTLAAAATNTGQLSRATLNPIMVTGSRAVPTDVEVVLTRRSTDPLDEVRHL